MEYYVDQLQMKQIDQDSTQEVGIPSMVLMERAALAVAETIMEDFAPSKGRVVSVCGKGNNGADGIAAARILRLKGYDAALLLTDSPKKATREWKEQFEIAKKLGIPYRFIDNLYEDEFIAYMTKNTAVCIDGIFGIGLTGDVSEEYAEIITYINKMCIPIIAVDIASGVNADTGQIAGAAIKAWKTVTFGRKKVGQMVYPGAEYTGKLKVCEIGFAPEAVRKSGYAALSYGKKDLMEALVPRPTDSHKGTFGKVLVVAGSANMAGAAVFSARAAYRMGCGLVRILTAKENRLSMHQMVPEAILSVYNENQSEKEIRQLTADCIQWADVIVFGPGVGQSKISELMLATLLTSNTSCPVVLDADGLRLLSRHKDWYKKVRENWIFTPHLGEMEALTGIKIAELKSKQLVYAKKMADTMGCICIMKGARTLVAAPGKKMYINTSGCSAMATAGSGDVLTGIIAGFLAEKKTPVRAARLGVYLHGLAGEAAARKLGDRSVMATDLVEAIAEVLQETTAGR